MEKFGLFDVISKLSGLNAENGVFSSAPKNQEKSPKNNLKTSAQSAKHFILRHEELSRKIDKNSKK